MNTINVIGNIAAFLTTISFLPQALKTKNTKDLSLPMYLLFISGVFLWIIYGVYSWQPSIILGNTITFILAGVILVYKLNDTRKK